MQNLKKIENFIKELKECNTLQGVVILVEKYFQTSIEIVLKSDLPIEDKKIIPIYINDNIFGYIKTEKDDENFKSILPVVMIKIENLILAEKMKKNIKFHDSMKNIAKIIETQYDYDYIIPIIGEITDKFIQEHLVYIFLKDNGKLKLAWPLSCRDKNIENLLKNITQKSATMITENKKIGLFPMINENTLIGCIVTKSTDEDLSLEDINYLEQISSQSATTLNRAKFYGEILQYATVDALTGFYNRRQMEDRLKQEISKSRRQKAPLCAIMSDIDYFKKVNDTYGHAVGDLVLKTTAKVMKAELREYDIAARYGGEEFVFLLPFTTEDEAKLVAERLRAAVEKKIIDIEKINPYVKEKNIHVTISLGIYQFKDNDKNSELLQKADKALYEAKETGRNKVIAYRNEI